jgi:tRNA nucleotidyltransferase (CCA-adding enzyme)
VWYKYSQEIQRLPIELPDYMDNILSDIKSIGGRALIVGGAVRDAILGGNPKDIDIEVYKVSYEDLVKILKKYGRADLVGQSFAVINFVGPDGLEFDFSLPRTDSKIGVGHKDFDIKVDSNLSPKEAAARRDFTINAISYDPLTGEIIDPYNGREDLKNKILRHTSNAFADDPLRILRGMNFIGRLSEPICNNCGCKMKLIENSIGE